MNNTDLHTLVETSGTTGEKKRVVHRVGTMIENARAFNEHMGFGSDLRWYHCFPTDYTAGFLNLILCPMVAGSRVFTDGEFSAERALNFWKRMAHYGCDAVWLSPEMVEAITKADRGSFGEEYADRCLKHVCVGTGPLAREVQDAWEDRYGVRLLESYGLSELLIVSATRPGKDHGYNAGMPLPGVRLRQDSNGALEVKTDYLFQGYLDCGRELQQFAIKDDNWWWWPTGDEGHLTKNGQVVVAGRIDDK